MLRPTLVGGLILMSLTAAFAKSGPTYYTPERIARGQQNLAHYEWGKATLRSMLAGGSNDYYIGREYGSATDCLAQTDDFIWLMQPTTKLPRVPPDHETLAMCPVHGEEVRKYSAWTAWTSDPIHHPYKVRCRAGGEWYPSNDYLNGDLTSGEFPDDGNGCLYKGKRYYFLREYAHMAYGNNTIPCLRSLSQAWLLTGDKRYARKGCILLARLASEYPNFTDRKDRLFYAPYGGTDPYYTWKHGGMITDFIWECFCLEATVYAYDGLWSYMDQDPEMLRYLKSKGLPVENAGDLRKYIEENLIRVGMEGILNGYIHGNEGFHQAAALACALVMDDWDESRHPNSRDLVEYAFQGGGRSAYIIINGLTLDGGGNESPGYNEIRLDFIRVNRLMEEVRQRQPALFPKDRYPDLFGNAKGRRIFDHYIDLVVNNDIFPSIGDCGGISDPPVRRPPRVYSGLDKQNLYALERFHDARFARALSGLSGSLPPGEVFEAYPEAEIKALLKTPASRIERVPRLLDGYGEAIVESGQWPAHRAFAVNYTSLYGHRQYDNLNLELWARGVDLMPDLGYPYTWDHRETWDAAQMAHNTVTVDQTNAAYGRGGACGLMVSADGVHAVTTRHDPYPAAEGKAVRNVDLYERTTVMVDVSPEQSYVVDLFAVSGGEEQIQSWHGPLRPVQVPPLAWTEQPTGTLAGPEVAQFASFTDRWGREGKAFACYLAKIRRATVAEPATWSWDYGLPEGDALRLHLVPVGGPLEVIVGTGRSGARPETWGLDYVLARRQAGAVPSHFLTVLEPYQKTPLITGVRLLSEKPLVLAVERGAVVDEITLATPDGSSRPHQHRALGLRVRTRQGSHAVRDLRVGDYGETSAPGYTKTVIRRVDYEHNQIRLRHTAERAGEMRPGRYVRIFNRDRTGMFRIVAAQRDEDDLLLTLDSPALLAQGPVVKTAPGALWINAYLDWTLSSNTPEGGLIPQAGGDYYAGAWLGEGSKARQVRGAIRDMPSKVFFAQDVPAETLEQDYGGQVINLWAYGVGDRIEVPRVVQ
jgi:oligo-alginate lyase